MARILLYLDENIQISLADALRMRGVDVLTTQEAGNIGLKDEEQLIFARERRRVLLSYNKRDFARIHYEWMKVNKSHSGIIVSEQLNVGTVLKRFMKLYFSLSSEDMINRLEYLSSWK